MSHFGIDLDGVCFDWQYFVDWHNSVYLTSFTKEEFLNPDFPERFDVPLSVLHKRVDKMYKTVGIRNLLPAVGSVKGVRELAGLGKTSIITARPPISQEDTLYWIKAYYHQGINGNIHFSKNHHFPSTTSHLPTKAEICIREGIDYLFEDDLKHAIPCADVGVQILLFHYHGNSLAKHKNIHRVYSWQETVAKVKELEKL